MQMLRKTPEAGGGGGGRVASIAAFTTVMTVPSGPDQGKRLLSTELTARCENPVKETVFRLKASKAQRKGKKQIRIVTLQTNEWF